MRRVGLGVLLLGWLYGVPFLLVVGLLRRTSADSLPTRAAAQAYGATTDRFLTTALLLNAVLPMVGVLLAHLLRDGYWTRHFVGALVGMVLLFGLVMVAESLSTGPLIGWTPEDQEPAPRVTRCIPTSGGRSCPGG